MFRLVVYQEDRRFLQVFGANGALKIIACTKYCICLCREWQQHCGIDWVCTEFVFFSCFLFSQLGFFFFMLFPQSWEAAKQPRLRVTHHCLLVTFPWHILSQGRAAAGEQRDRGETGRMWVGQQREGEERASKGAKVGLKSTRKWFYCSGVSAWLCTCVFQKGKCLQKKRKNHLSKWNRARMLPQQINVDVWLFKASQRVRREQNRTFKTMVAPDARNWHSYVPANEIAAWFHWWLHQSGDFAGNRSTFAQHSHLAQGQKGRRESRINRINLKQGFIFPIAKSSRSSLCFLFINNSR